MPEITGRIILLAAVLGIIFGLIGGVMAYIIVYTEYRKHLISTRRVIQEGLRAGVTAFIVLLVGALVTGLAVSLFARR
jgi:H+/Cl- antiporter ClcA